MADPVSSDLPIVITGGDGFIGTNLRIRLAELGYTNLIVLERDATAAHFSNALMQAGFVFHLAGVNRPKHESEFEEGNAALTESVCATLLARERQVSIVLASSIQAALDNPYGRSKRAAEEAVLRYAKASGAPGIVFRLANVFGKWARPNYNSAVATFCHNLARGEAITVNDPAAPLRLVYIDDVVTAMVGCLDGGLESGYAEVEPQYATTVGAVADALRGFVSSRTTNTPGLVGVGLERALYATYLSYLRPEAFGYNLVRHGDARGVFGEMLRTPGAGQFSFFTAHPGITRGGHYHHSKTEKFLVLTGTARFGFRHIVTNERAEITVKGSESRVIETVPGWSHDITNIGEEEMVVMLWANENFDPAHPDTYAAHVL